jgi:hypothetical protein
MKHMSNMIIEFQFIFFAPILQGHSMGQYRVEFVVDIGGKFAERGPRSGSLRRHPSWGFRSRRTVVTTRASI